jgi:hypothetical protein
VATHYLMDENNPTGYAQALMENNSTVATTAYVPGLDVIGQSNSNSTGSINGDANHDGNVDAVDLGIMAAHWQQTGVTWEDGGFTGDGKVEAFDNNLPAQSWQMGILLVLLYDGHGSTRTVTGSTGYQANQFRYDAYGNLLSGANLTWQRSPGFWFMSRAIPTLTKRPLCHGWDRCLRRLSLGAARIWDIGERSPNTTITGCRRWLPTE